MQAARHGRAPALCQDGHTLSYAQWAQQVQHMAAWLAQAWGVRAGDRVAYLGLNRIDQITLLFALARLGALLVPLNYRLARPECQAILADCKPHLLLHDAEWADAAHTLGRQGPWRVAPLAQGASASHEPPLPDEARPDSPLLLVYTSGTSGRPKGALHTQANLLANMMAAAQVQALSPQDRVLTVLPLFHVGGLCIQTLPALYAGAQVHLLPRFDAQTCLAALARERITLTLQVPATLKALSEHAHWHSTDLSPLRAVWAGSSLLPDSVIQPFHARGIPVCNVYGSTETGPFSIALPPAQAISHLGSCGWPAPGVEVRLHQVVNGVGELLLRGAALVQRYWPDQAALDDEGWFHSGDLGVQAADGSYRIAGRAKDIIISGGENIDPSELENVLLAQPSVAECAVLGWPDARWGEAVLALVVLQPGARADAAALMAQVTSRLARYKHPRRIVFVPGLPKTALGKVQKHSLLAALQNQGFSL